MNNIVLPKKVTFTPSKEKNSGQVVIEPCYPGYGTTLGNGIRRVLLSSLPGAAVIGVKIKNASHEFTTIDGVKEDVLEIILNLKQLRLKVFKPTENEVIKLELKVSGIKKVTADDITKNSKVEVASKDLHILEITDKKTEVELEIFIMHGYGYLPIEGREHQEKEVGYIDIDAVFSSVKVVKVEIENVRVGKMTNWDKLVIDIKTDGTIDFKEALQEVTKILVEQFSFLLEQSAEAPADKSKKKKSDKKKKKQEEEDDESADDESITDKEDEEK
ncbi:MAG: DNA-directed RNA polymerase subunit alpha [Candidatus Falkowbacteria bacterium]